MKMKTISKEHLLKLITSRIEENKEEPSLTAFINLLASYNKGYVPKLYRIVEKLEILKVEPKKQEKKVV